MNHFHRACAKPIWHGMGCLLALCALQPQPSLAVDTEPGNYTALPPGSSAVGLYYHRIARDAQYVNGNKLQNHPELNTDLVQMKAAHYLDMGGYTVAPGFILSCGRTQAGGGVAALGSVEGCWDLLAGGTLWAINNPGQRNYFGISPYFMAPTGDYDKNRALNLGENRWKHGVNAGYITPLSEHLMLDLVGDLLWSGKNSEYGPHSATLEQDVVYNVQLHLRYNLDESTRFSASYLHDWGGETAVNGIWRNDRKNQGRYRVGAAKFLNRHNLLQVEAGADTHVENGFKEKSRLILRYVMIF